MENTKKAYKEILKTLNKYKEDIVFDVLDLERKAKNHLFGVDLVEKYGFKIDPKRIYSTDWQELMDNMHIGYWDGKVRKISWSDDDRQPENEILLCLNYPTGAYIFGEDYPAEFFKKFFLELKSYTPKYTDTKNKSLYFSMDNAGIIYNAYEGILKRYYEENKYDLNQRKIKQLKHEIEKLKNI